MKKYIVVAVICALTAISSLGFAQQKKIIVLSPQVTISGNVSSKWTQQNSDQLSAQLAAVYQGEVVRKLLQQRNRNKFRNKNIQIIALRAGDEVPVGYDVAYVVVPRVNHVIYMSPMAAQAINFGSALVNFNTPAWAPYVRANDSYCSVNVNEGNSRSIIVANRRMTYSIAARLFKWLQN
jgi:hypothetical protein